MYLYKYVYTYIQAYIIIIFIKNQCHINFFFSSRYYD